MSGDRYRCPKCDATPRRYGEVHSCSGYDEHFVVYLNPTMTPFFLTERGPGSGLVRRFEQAWQEYKRAWAQSISPMAGVRDIDPDFRRRALRAFRAGWRAAIRSAVDGLGEDR